MQELLKPIKNESLKDICVARLEELILSAKLPIGQKLPSERELALQLGVSRPVVHEGLVELAVKGLVTLKPRVGTVVNDYRKEGSLSLLTSLANYHQGQLDPNLLRSLLDMRLLFEVETARLAAMHRSDEHLLALDKLLDDEKAVSLHQVEKITALDFEFHHLIAMATDNSIYPLLLNSFKQFYFNLAGQFFSNPKVIVEVFQFHQTMVHAIKKRDADQAMAVMKAMLVHGEEHLKGMIEQETNEHRTSNVQHRTSNE
jgi:fatty acid metabolism transcriptional regulator FadR